MPAKVIYIAGVPASGKSTLMAEIRRLYFANSTAFRRGKVRGIQTEDGRYRMLGVFDGSAFEGTDKLSNSVIDEALEYIAELQREPGNVVVFAEGDRLFNRRFITESGATLLLIDANERILAKRHNERMDSQAERFLQSRRTKVENYIKKYGTMRIWNNTPEDSKRIIDFIVKKTDQFVAQKT